MQSILRRPVHCSVDVQAQTRATHMLWLVLNNIILFCIFLSFYLSFCSFVLSSTPGLYYLLVFIRHSRRIHIHHYFTVWLSLAQDKDLYFIMKSLCINDSSSWWFLTVSFDCYLAVKPCKVYDEFQSQAMSVSPSARNVPSKKEMIYWKLVLPNIISEEKKSRVH